MGRLNQFFPSHAVPNSFALVNIEPTKCIAHYISYTHVQNQLNRISHSHTMEVQSMLTFVPTPIQDGRQVIFLEYLLE